MEQIEELSRFIKEHASDDLNRLLLSASRYPGIDIPFVVDQLKSRRQIKDKLPSWYQNDRLVFPVNTILSDVESLLFSVPAASLYRADTYWSLTGL